MGRPVAGVARLALHPVTRWLHAAAGILPTYTQRVLARHTAAATEYGDTWRTRNPVDLAKEVAEEGLDVAGWAMLVGERLDALDPAARATAAARVERLVQLGAMVTAEADRLAALCAHHPNST